MSHFNSKTKYFKHLEHRLRDATSERQKLKGKEITTYADRSIIANADGYSLSIVKRTLSDKCFEHIKWYRLDLNLYDIRMLQITLNSVEKYWYSGLFKTTDGSEYNKIIKKWKENVYTAVGLSYFNKHLIEVPILPHVMQGLLRRYFMKMDINMNMKEDKIKTIFEIFDGDRIAKMSHQEVIKIELLCDSLEIKLKDKNIDFNETDLYPYIIEHFGQDYFITKDPNRSRWKECQYTKSA